MTMRSLSALLIALALHAVVVAQGGASPIYGIKSCGSSPGHCAVVSSATPAHLFRFLADGTSFTDLGLLREGGASADVDGLAWSAAWGLVGFVLEHGAVDRSALVGVDPATAVVTRRGALLEREIRGAVFDRDDVLLVLDARNDVMLRIDPVTGTELGSSTAITVAGQPHALSNVCDLAVRDDGALFLVDSERIFSLDPASGVAVELARDAPNGLAGAAFARSAPSNHLFVYEVTNTDDLFRYDLGTAGTPRATVHGNILSWFNAGRGDLASLHRTDLFARCAFRNGRGLNPIGYACVSAPVLGANWQTSIAMTPNSVASFVAIAIFPDRGIPFGNGEILIGLVPDPMLLVGAGAHALTIPNVSTLLGALVPTQGFRLDNVGPTTDLVPLNAEDLVLGL
ncbi:MAG: hypothetical protein HZB39_06020 [Planctomycetes bacterium]|nr:hypothetical protein [Planctomycetota bacterium]